MFLRALCALFFSSVKACAIFGFLWALAFAVKAYFFEGDDLSVFLSIFVFPIPSMLIGLLIAFPAIFVGAGICCYLIKKPNMSAPIFIAIGTVFSGIYGVLFQLMTTWDFFVTWACIFTAPFASWFMWQESSFYCKDNERCQN